MNNEQILENWNLQFKDQKKLNIEETKKTNRACQYY